jgi:hypothetical protein
MLGWVREKRENSAENGEEEVSSAPSCEKQGVLSAGGQYSTEAYQFRGSPFRAIVSMTSQKRSSSCSDVYTFGVMRFPLNSS